MTVSIEVGNGFFAEQDTFNTITEVRERLLDHMSRAGFEPYAKGDPMRSRRAFIDTRADFEYYCLTNDVRFRVVGIYAPSVIE